MKYTVILSFRANSTSGYCNTNSQFCDGFRFIETLGLVQFLDNIYNCTQFFLEGGEYSILFVKTALRKKNFPCIAVNSMQHTRHFLHGNV